MPAAARPTGTAVIGIDLAGDVDRRADVTDPSSTIAALAGADAVVHAAAIVGEVGRMDDHVRVNVGGTRNVLDAAAGRRVVVLTSVAVWGYEFTRDMSEDSPPRPVRAAVHRHQGRRRGAGAAARRDGRSGPATSTARAPRRGWCARSR